MKKILLLLTILMLYTSSVWASFVPNPERWEWLNSTDKKGYFIERNSTTTKNYSYTTIYAWVLIVDITENTHYIDKLEFRHPYKDVRTTSYIIYDDNTGKILESGNGTGYEKFEPIIPDTFGEAIYERLLTRHHLAK